MKPILIALVALAAVANVACTDKVPSKEAAKGTASSSAAAVPALLATIDQANDQCRGLSLDSAQGASACQKRDRL